MENNNEKAFREGIEDSPQLEQGKNIKEIKKQKDLAQMRTPLGFKTIPNDNIPSKWLFNESNGSLKIRSADWEEIKHYSLMDEESDESVDDHINDILLSCSKVGVGDYRDLVITDKLHTFFSIRDYTLMNNDSKKKVFMDFTSRKGKKKRVEITSSVFEYFDIPGGLMKWYSETERCFVINPDFLKEPIRIYAPKVGVVDMMKKYISDISARKNAGENVYLDKDFIPYSQYMIKDWREIDDEFKYIEELRTRFYEMTAEEIQIFTGAVKMLKVGIKPTIKIKFDDGNVEVFPIVFRGYKSLFYLSDRVEDVFRCD